jgi:hypothetical protein
MTEIFDQLLTRIVEGDEAAREGFGFSRMTTAGVLTPGGVFEWEDRLEIRGDGMVSQTTCRSFADNPGDRPGLYELRTPPASIGYLAGLIRDAKLEDLPPVRTGVASNIIRLSVVADGIAVERAVSARDPDALEPLQPLLNAFIPLTVQLQQYPTMALDLELRLDAPPKTPVGPAELKGVLRFSNPGRRGFWIAHPAALEQDGRFERCELVYGQLPVIEPDIMPRPLELQQAPLTAQGDGARGLIWLHPGGEALIPFGAELTFAEPGRHFVRAVFATYHGGVSIGGQTRFQGAVFSKDVMVEAG